MAVIQSAERLLPAGLRGKAEPFLRALASDEIDAYVDYSGTLWSNVLRRTDRLPPDRMLSELAAQLVSRDRVTLLGALGFENAYALAMKSSRARALGIRTLDDLARHAPQLALGADLEFLARPEWSDVRDAYRLQFRETRSYNPTFMYRALSNGAVDVISAFSSDGRILAQDLVTLEDPRGALPRYDAVLLLAPKRAQDESFRAALAPLVGAIDLARMRRANLEVDRDTDKRTPADAAATLMRGSATTKR